MNDRQEYAQALLEAYRTEYAQALLEAYRTLPGTTGKVRRQDRALADQLFDRGVPLRVVQNALTLAALRRIHRPADAPPLLPIRSLAYFLDLITEVLSLDPADEYFDLLRQKLRRLSTSA